MKNYKKPSSGNTGMQMSNDMRDYRKSPEATDEARQVREQEERASRREQERVDRESSREAAREQREQNRLAQKELKEQEKRDKKLREAEDNAERIRIRQESVNRGTTTKDFRDMAHKNRGKEPYKPVEPITSKTIVKKVGDVAGGVLISGMKEMQSDGHGRSGKRLSLAYRHANRNYNNEAKRMGSQVATPGALSSKMLFGVDKTPVRSRAKGMNQFAGVTDPLSNFTSNTLLGSQTVRQDTTIEGIGRKMVRRESPKKGDPLKNFSKMIGGF
jgi:hypothetical protein